MERRYQPHQAEEVVAMEVADIYLIYRIKPYAEVFKSNLATFAAVYKDAASVDAQKL
jgi:hypothetical protein